MQELKDLKQGVAPCSLAILTEIGEAYPPLSATPTSPPQGGRLAASFVDTRKKNDLPP